MPIAKLSIDLEARLAGLQAGLDKAGFMAAKTANQIEGAFKGLQSVLGGLGAGLAASISVAGLSALIRNTVDGIDKLNDLADATGDTVENLSALEDIAARTGTSLDTASDAVLKLNKALGEAAKDPSSDAARAIKNLGLEISDLLKLSPVERLQAVGRAMNSFDGENKLFYNLTLLGKGTRELAPLMKDLGEAGELVATVTKQQAEEAEKFNKELFALQKSATDAARAMTGPLISAINEVAAVFRAGEKAGKGFFETLWLGTRLLNGGGATGEWEDGGGATGSWGDGPSKPRLPALDPPSKPSKPSRGGRSTTPDRPGTPGLLLDRQEAFRASEQAQQAAIDEALRVGQLTQAEKEHADALRLVADEQRRLNDIIGSTPQGKLDAVLDDIGFITAQFDKGKLSADEWAGAVETLAGKIHEAADETKQFSEETSKEIGLVFASAAGDAIAHWEGVRAVLKGVLADLAQIVLKKSFTEPAGNAIGGFLSNIDWGSIIGSAFGSANGNAFNAQGLVAFAGGGVIDSPTLFGYGRGRAGVMGEAGPEGILPLKRGRDGKLGVQAQGGGMTVVFNLAAGTTADDFRRSQRQIEADLGRTMRRAGAIA